MVTWLTDGGKYLSVSVFWWKRKFYFLVKTARLRALVLPLVAGDDLRRQDRPSFEIVSFLMMTRKLLECYFLHGNLLWKVIFPARALFFRVFRPQECLHLPEACVPKSENSSRFSSEKEIVHFRSLNANRLWMRSNGSTFFFFLLKPDYMTNLSLYSSVCVN